MIRDQRTRQAAALVAAARHRAFESERLARKRQDAEYLIAERRRDRLRMRRVRASQKCAAAQIAERQAEATHERRQ